MKSEKANQSVSIEEIRAFCDGCDNYKNKLYYRRHCKLTPVVEQKRRVLQKKCGWAEKNGVDGDMTESGFIKQIEY
jgi:hypothetical protein